MANAYEETREFQKAGDAYEKYLLGQPAERLDDLPAAGDEPDERQPVRRRRGGPGRGGQGPAPGPEHPLQPGPGLPEVGQARQGRGDLQALAVVVAEGRGDLVFLHPRHVRQGQQWPKAIEAAQKIAELKPNDDQSVYNLGLIYQQLQKYPEAIEQYKKAVAIKPTSDLAWFQIGYCYYMLKNYNETISAMQKNVELVPDHVFGWMYIGMCYMQTEAAFDKALDPMKKAVDLQGDNPTPCSTWASST